MALDWSPVERRLARELRRAVAAFVRRHPSERVRAVAIDATPHDDFFAVCFDCGDHPLVGNYTHHLFHEFSAGVRAPRGGWPPARRGSRDGFVEAELRKVLTRVLRELADGGGFARLPTGKQLLAGYCYHDSVFVLCRRVRVARPVAPAKQKRPGRAPIDSREAQDQFHADWETAYQRATPYFEAALAGSKKDQHSACNILYGLIRRVGVRPIDARWKARAKAALDHPVVGGYAADLLEELSK
jgi:hypothetical protein